ncbi:hypothetical protein Dvina_32690 [Dactylosporangium vinaceum]|uniref:Uncharacterized protein n=1 Tax=Dactylosporangium vinaceum TaxID=53362 RepID=A0ABV5MA92_9ACTN|nr:hypothetical protein [Dactylosporangium vinaceum]UAB93045.1 hypothetical protein Dvina_32690 [Dactylosporangium vinaceum]
MTTNQPNERLEALPDDDFDDFAAEHEDTTLADQVEGGPEGSSEPESPRGRAGMD